MLEVQNFYCLGHGVPSIPGTWRPAVLVHVKRKDPFSGATTTYPTWQAAEDDLETSPTAEGYSFADLRVNTYWTEAQRIFANHAATLHDGILFELWAAVVDEPIARAAWRPSWITEDGHAQLIQFPDSVTERLANAQAEDLDVIAKRWQNFPYLRTAAGSSAPIAVEAILRVVCPLSRIAFKKEAGVFAEVAGYSLP